MKKSEVAVLGTCLLGILSLAPGLATSAGAAIDKPFYDAAVQAPAAKGASSAGLVGDRFPAYVASFDETRGLPSFVWAIRAGAPVPGENAVQAARGYLKRHSGLYGLSAQALATVTPTAVHDTGRGGIIVSFGQEIDGVEVFRDQISLLMTRDLELVALGGYLHPRATPQRIRAGSRLAFQLPAEDAVARATRDMYGQTLSVTAHGQEANGYRDYVLERASGAPAGNAVTLTQPARAKQVLFPMPDRLVPAYYVEVFAQIGTGRESDSYAYVFSAKDGRLLHRRNLTVDAHQYRVWADEDPLHTPLEGPVADFTPFPASADIGDMPALVDSRLIEQAAFNTAPGGGSDPWLPADATVTTGNNVDAYADHNDPDGFTEGDIRANMTGPDTFNWVYDHNQEPFGTEANIKAAVVSIFHVINWHHDWFYDSGFDEVAGNAQTSNYGRGGEENDVLLAEAQDAVFAGQRNNANMSTPADGRSPRMQMYIWTTPDLQTFNAGSLGDLVSNTASFGPQEFDVLGDAVIGLDDADVLTDGCEPFSNPGLVAGRIAVVDRGSCAFVQKAMNAQAAGAVALLIVNNQPGGIAPGLGGSGPDVTIPVVSVSLEDGDQIKQTIASDGLTLSFSRVHTIDRDGTIDNNVVAHEWGHYIHNRLVDCGNIQCRGMGEGWGDFLSVLQTIREGDDYHGIYADSTYASRSAYFGIRRVPYSADFDFNALTFQHISDGVQLPTTHPIAYGQDGTNNSEVHNAGEIWTSMLTQGYVGLLDETKGASARYDFLEAKRRMTDYIVAGMKLAPPFPTYVEQRDGILAAAFAADPRDMLILAEGFAVRGMGSGARAPERLSEDLTGVTESYRLAPEARIVDIQVDDSAASCDNDGILDAGETAWVTVEITNTGVANLASGKLFVFAQGEGVTYPAGQTAAVSSIQPFGTDTARIQIALDDTVQGVSELRIVAVVTDPGAVDNQVVDTAMVRTNLDEKFAVSLVDTVEVRTSPWKRTEGPESVAQWHRESEEDVLNHVWHGRDPDGIGDLRLESPALQVSSSGNFQVSFDHRYSFEVSSGVFWDGAVIELSNDNGATWQDVSAWVRPGYDAVLDDQFGNPLGGRRGFGGQSASWPAMQRLLLDFGTEFAGQVVNIRFRVGSDAGVGDHGWDVDNIAVAGVDNLPFPRNVAEDTVCTALPPEDGTGEPTPPGPPAPAPVPDPTEDSGGCGCRVGASPGSSSPLGAVFLGFAALGAVVLRRKRRR